MTITTELAQREKFEAWVMTQVCISKTTLEGLRTDDGYRNDTLSGTNYNRLWRSWLESSNSLLDALTAKDKQIAELTEWVNQSEARNNVKCAELCNQDEVIDSLRQSIAELESRPEQQPVKRVTADQMHRVCLEGNRHLDKYAAMAKEVNKLLLSATTNAPAAQPVTVKLPGCVDDLHGVGLVMSAEAVVEALTASGITIAEGSDMSRRKPPRRTKHSYLVSFISHNQAGAQVASHRSLSMTKRWSEKDTDSVVAKLGEWTGYTNIVITNVFYTGKS